MRKCILGKDLEVSAMGLGCMGMTHGFGNPSDEREMIDVICSMWDTQLYYR